MQHHLPAGCLFKAQGHYSSAGREDAKTEQVSLKLNLDPEKRTQNAVRTTKPHSKHAGIKATLGRLGNQNKISVFFKHLVLFEGFSHVVRKCRQI